MRSGTLAAAIARFAAFCASLSAFVASSVPAYAHTPIEGAGSFYNGVLHPVFVPAHAIAVITLGLLLGQQGRRHILLGMPAFIAAVAIGLVFAAQGAAYESDVPVLALAAAAGLYVAWARVFPPWPFAVAAAAYGLCIGLASLPDDLTGNARVFALIGTGVGATMIVLYVAGAVDWLRRPWQRIGIRVAGSWAAAISLMVLALSIAPR